MTIYDKHLKRRKAKHCELQEGGSGAGAEVTAELESLAGWLRRAAGISARRETVSVRCMSSRVQVMALQRHSC